MGLRNKLLILIFLLILSAWVHAEEWHHGFIILKSQKVLKGELSIQSDYDVVFFRNGDALMVYPAYKISSFQYHDGVENVDRKFVSIEHDLGTSIKNQIYEIVLDGKVSLLRRQKSVWYSIHLEFIEYDYFVKTEDEILPLNKFKRKVYPVLLESSSDKLKAFVSRYKLSPSRLHDIIKIIDYFNKGQSLLAQK